MDTNARTLAKAIQSRHKIEFTYEGIRGRVGEPAMLGFGVRGTEVVKVFQTEGAHHYPRHDWDLCKVSKMEDLKIMDETFDENPPHYKAHDHDRNISIVYAELEDDKPEHQ